MDKDLQQRITRLTPLADVMAIVDAQVRAVMPREFPLAEAGGLILAEDVRAADAAPPRPAALRDGFAVRSDMTADASAYAPIPLAQKLVQVDVGDPLPADADAVASFDGIAVQNGIAHLVRPVAPGEGVLPAGSDSSPGMLLAPSGRRVRMTDLIAFEAAGIRTVRIRKAVIGIACAEEERGNSAALRCIENAAHRAGAEAVLSSSAFGHDFDPVSADAFVVIGGTGQGRKDRSVAALKRLGRVAVHGIGLMPGETTAFGFAGDRPVLLVPGRADAALSAWLAIGQRLIGRLCGTRHEEAGNPAMLSRKVVSTIGIADMVLVRRDGDRVEPLAAGHWPLQAMARADGWIVVPPQSEGYPEGAQVSVRPLP
ncbi:MAG TPA: molybdopterin-binding protein [Pseudorhodoplanes sp.]|jgi:molybdopterin biosynthesis enzyme|nr:molybdopterin-binding protein [Pseudorhodoplanes sp.]